MGLEDQFLGCSQDVLTNTPQSEFCTSDNWQTAVIYLSGELQKFGLPSPCTRGEGEESHASLDVIALVNSCWQLIQLHRRSQKTVLEMEMMSKKNETEIERLLVTASKQKEAIHLRERTAAESNEKERQAMEQLEAGNMKLKSAKEESRKLMCVLLQRESKYSHEIRRTEQENTKLKERLLKVLMEKGEGRGNFLELDAAIVKGNYPGRGKWTTYGNKDEEVIIKVMEELNYRDEMKTEAIRVLRESVFMMFETLQNILQNLSVEFQPTYLPMEVDTEQLILRTRSLCDLFNVTLSGCRLAYQVTAKDREFKLLQEKLSLFENILQSFEANESYEKVLQQLHEGGYLTSLEQERVNIQLEKTRLRKENDILEQSKREMENTREDILGSDLFELPEQCQVPQILSLPRQKVENLPTWALGPVTITPMSCYSTESGPGIVLGYFGNNSGTLARGTSSRPASRPGSQPGSRAPSLSKEPVKQVKGKSPAASLINRRNGRPSIDGMSSIGKKSRPKSANISPARSCNSPINIPYRQKSVGPSPSPGILNSDNSRGNYSSYTRSLPRNQLNLKPGQGKRRSGVWSKPPTPGPCTPGASDSEQ